MPRTRHRLSVGADVVFRPGHKVVNASPAVVGDPSQLSEAFPSAAPEAADLDRLGERQVSVVETGYPEAGEAEPPRGHLVAVHDVGGSSLGAHAAIPLSISRSGPAPCWALIITSHLVSD